MKITEYERTASTSSPCRRDGEGIGAESHDSAPTSSRQVTSDDVDYVSEVSTIPRVVFDGDEDPDEKVRVFHQPDETVDELVDDVDLDGAAFPVETTLLVVNEDELLDHETVANRDRTR